MIKIKKPKAPKVLKRKKAPKYILTFNYMIGDADGETTKTIETSADNPYVERFVKLLNKLKPNKGRWGVSLNEDSIDASYKQKQLKKADYEFLLMAMFEPSDEVADEMDEQELDYLMELSDGVRSETEYSFLTFQGIDLYYRDENGIKHETVIK